MKTKLLVYTAGPISKGNPLKHFREAIHVAETLIEKGYALYVPQLSIFWDMLIPHAHDWWIEYDYPILARCDVLLRLPGESVGADMEVKFCQDHNIPVVYSINELDEFRKEWEVL